MYDPPPEEHDAKMQCVVVGGCAHGVVMKDIRVGASQIQLGKPTHLKPLESSQQAEPEAAMERDVYNVYTFWLPTYEDGVIPFGFAVIDGKPLSWGISEIVRGFLFKAVDDLKEKQGNILQ